ncbi:MAG: 6-pyruvoyl-tetrahydropterin synthase-related protein [Dehalococcoidia bacterium]|nr:6-pyruvoyl-tetrahydropterin synthase-related protein [Dehalococcoidia bacterium]
MAFASPQRFLVPIVIIFLSLPALRFLMVSSYFEAHDGLLHLLRLVELDASLRSGDLFPRWSPDLALGYGYPLFNFYPPLAYYLAEGFHLLGLSFGDAMKALIAGGLLVSGLSMYLFTKDLFQSRPAALLSSIAYVYFPYHLTDIYVRGAIPEATIISLLPVALWLFHRLASRVQAVYLIPGALVVAGIILSHVTFIFFLPILAVYYVWTVSFLSKAIRRALILGVAAFGLGAALAAFYWLPVLLEEQYVAANNADWVTEDAFRSELHDWDSLVQWRPTFDYQAKFPPKLAPLDLIMAIGGLGVGLIRKNNRKFLRTLSLFLVAMPLLAFLISEPSSPFWERMPLAGMIQFPWRLLSFVGLATSVLAGLAARAGKFSYPVAALACLAIILAGTWDLKIKQLEYPDSSLTLGTLARYEYDSGVMGTAYGNEWLPVTAKPGFTSPLYGAIESKKTEGIAAIAIDSFRPTGANAFAASVEAPNPSHLRLHSFYFPGWQARVDGKEVATYPSTDPGIVTFDIPEGRHEVSLSFGDTGVRALSRILSLLALLALALVATKAIRKRYSHGPPVLLGLAGLPLLFVVLAIMQSYVFGDAVPAKSISPVDLAGRLRLLSYETKTTYVDGEAVLDVTLFWQTLQPERDDLKLSLEAHDRQGKVVAMQMGAPIYGTAPTSAWGVNEIVRERREIRLTGMSSPGPVVLRLGLMTDETPLGSTELGAVNIESRPTLPLPIPDHRVETAFGDRLLLLGYSRTSPTGLQSFLAPGGFAGLRGPTTDLRVTLFWQALSTMEQDYVVSLRLVDDSGNLIAYHDSQPQMGFRPTSLWQRGEMVEDVHLPGLPPDFESGIYTLEVGLYQPHTGERLWPAVGGSTHLKLGPIELRR